MIRKFTILLVCLFLGILSCTETGFIENPERIPVLPANPYNYSKLELPEGSNFILQNNIINIFRSPDGKEIEIFGEHPGSTIKINDLNGNIVIFTKTGSKVNTSNENFFQTKITDKGATLGRVLFYDQALSVNDKISCGSCHHQDKAFADGLKVSKGFGTAFTERNSMAITNPVLQRNLFWDSRARTISDLSLQPVQNHIEMGMELIEELPEKLAQKPYYASLFKEAYGDSNISKERISDAISQFVGSITTSKSKFDKRELNTIEKKGFDVFINHCSSCHSGPNFAAADEPGGAYGSNFGTGEDLRGATNIGLDLISRDNGVGNGRFRIPSLRNIMVTAPYMHDGRFKTIDEVLDFYTSGIKPSAHLDKKFRNPNGSVRFIPINSAEKLALKAFLGTLTDEEMMKNPKYSDPFVD